jgi:hypothetical protein
MVPVGIAEEKARRAQDEADAAQRAADRLHIQAWNERMNVTGVAQPSPTIRMATWCGYRYLRVRCAGCRQSAWIELSTLRRRPDTPVHTLEGSLACKVCRDRGVRAPRGTMERLTRNKSYGNDED